MNKLGYVFVFFLVTFIGAKVYAQEQQTQINPHSVYPVVEEHKLYKRTVWRRMNLDEKQNWPFFSSNNEITKIILDAVRDGRLTPYQNDSLVRRMTKEEFFEKLKLDSGEDEGSWGDEGGDDAWGGGAAGGDDAWGDAGDAGGGTVDEYIFASELKLLNIMEDVYFDKIRSRMYYDILSIEMMIPAAQSATGVERPLGTFRFKDLEQLFRSMPNEAIWYNPYNTAQHRNLADAFLLRLFSARITKISNPRNEMIQDIFVNEKEALYQSQIQEYKMVEFEHDLWEY